MILSILLILSVSDVRPAVLVKGRVRQTSTKKGRRGETLQEGLLKKVEDEGCKSTLKTVFELGKKFELLGFKVFQVFLAVPSVSGVRMAVSSVSARLCDSNSSFNTARTASRTSDTDGTANKT